MVEQARRLNPLLREVARGLTSADGTSAGYFNYLLLQAVVLFMWWPKSSLAQVLQSADRPDTLLAVAVISLLTLGYHQVRAGAEEFLLPGQHPLREWVSATPLALARIMRGYLSGALLQVMHALALSSPLWVIAFTVSDARVQGVLFVFLATALLAMELRLLAALIYLLLGQREALCFVTVRAGLVLGLLLPVLVAPSMNHFAVVSAALAGGVEPVAQGTIAVHGGYLAGHGALCGLLAAALHACLSRQRLSVPPT